MTHPATPPRLVLIADRRSEADIPAPIAPRRRYRLARVHLERRPAAGAARFDYLKRTHD